jgi:hypothetical protein
MVAKSAREVASQQRRRQVYDGDESSQPLGGTWMQVRFVLAVTALLWAAPTFAASSIEQALARLDPEERSHQACILRGLEAVQRHPRLRRADRMKTSIFSRAVLDGTLLTAKGGAVRVGDHWYTLSFSCQLTGDYMKATSFSFMLGSEIPRIAWDRLGLWR